MRKLTLLAVLAGLLPLAAGCGRTSVTAGPASEEDKRRDLEEQKKVEAEERGTPVKKGQAKKPN